MEKKSQPDHNTRTVLVGVVAASAAAIGVFVWAYFQSKFDKQERKKHRKLLGNIQRSFSAKKDEILAAAEREPWNHFDQDKLQQIYTSFLNLLENKQHGILNRIEFRALQKKAHVTDERVVESLFRFFDQNIDGSVDFLELVQCLNLLCFGTRTEQLRQLFRIYDHDENNFISREELEIMFHSFFDTHQSHDVKKRVDAVFDAADKNMDNNLSLTEFLSLANRPEFEMIVTRNHYVLHFIGLFGLNEKNIRKQ